MAKSKILKELANNKVSLEVALSRLMLIASDIGDTELKNWATKELNGYGVDDECPPYRCIVSGNIVFSGIRGNAFGHHIKYTNAALSIDVWPEDYRDIILRPAPIKDSVAQIAHIFESKAESLYLNITFFAQALYEKNPDLQCTEIRQYFSYVQYGGILNSLRTKLIEIFIELDDSLGNLDDLDIESTGVGLKELQKVILNLIYQDNSVDNSVRIGDKNKIDSSNLQGGMSDGS